jgi:hypothetical protein
LLSGLDPKKSYIVVGTNPNFGQTIEPGGFLNPDTDTLTVSSSLALAEAGTWTFTIYQVNHNATPHQEFGRVTVQFD